MFVLIIFCAAFAAADCKIELVYSSSSPPSEIADLEMALVTSYGFDVTTYNLTTLPFPVAGDKSVLLDMTEMQVTPYHLMTQASAYQLPILQQTLQPSQSPYKFQYRSLDHGQAASALFTSFHWDRLFAVVQSDSHSQTAWKEFKALQPRTFVKEFLLSADIAQGSLEDLVARVARKYALVAYLVFGGSALGKKVEDALLARNLLVTGSLTVYAGSACLQITTPGSLCIFEDSAAEATTWAEYQAALVSQSLTETWNTAGACDIDAFLGQYPDHVRSATLGLYNLVNATRTKVGEYDPVTDQLTLTSSLTFIGTTQEVPETAFGLVEIGINDGILNPSGFMAPNNEWYLRGAHMSLQHLNEDFEAFPYHSFQLNSMSCGAFQYDYDFTKACLIANEDRLGVSYIHAVGSTMAKGIHSILEELGHTVPQLGCCGDSNDLENKDDYEYFVRMVKSKEYKGGLIAWLVKILGIKQCAVVHSDLDWALETIHSFVEVAESLDITILNEKRLIPNDFTIDQYEEYKDVFEEIRDTKARFLIYADTDSSILNGFYHAGLRKGDLVLLMTSPLAFDVEEGIDTQFVEELANSGITLDAAGFIDDFGAYVHEELTEFLNATPELYHCLSYDTVRLFRDAFELTLWLGEDVTDGVTMQSRIRMSRITGCSGTVSIESETNNRSSELYFIYQGTFNKTQQIVLYESLGVFNPTATVILSFSAPIVWPDGTTDKPSDIRTTDSDCPFDESEVEVNTRGLVVLAVLSVVVSLVSGAFCVLLYRRWWPVQYPEVEVKRMMRFNDIVTTAYIGIEALQIASQGPNFRTFIAVLHDLTKLSTVDLESFISIRNTYFFILLHSVLACCGVWVILGVIYLFELHRRFPHLTFLRFLYSAAETLLPYIGTILYLPIIATLLNVFNCAEGTGDALTDTFLAKDCTVGCWKDSHIAYAFFASMCLVTYQPIAVYSRPVWQEVCGDMFLYMQPRFILIKSIAQTVLIVLNVLVFPRSEVAHGILYILVVGIYVGLMWRWKPFNYRRADILQRIILIAIIWVAVVALLEEVLSSLWSNAPILTLLLGWGLIFIGGGVFYFLSPALLVLSQDKPLEPFFQFQFSRRPPEEFGISAKTLDFIDRSRTYLEPYSGRDREVKRTTPRLKF